MLPGAQQLSCEVKAFATSTSTCRKAAKRKTFAQKDPFESCVDPAWRLFVFFPRSVSGVETRRWDSCVVYLRDFLYNKDMKIDH